MSRDSAATGALSPREVAALVAQGLTNPQIAARLVISERTAARHVEHILNKLGFTSRANRRMGCEAGNVARRPGSVRVIQHPGPGGPHHCAGSRVAPTTFSSYVK